MCVYQGEIETHREKEFVCMLSVLRRSVCICGIAKHHSCGLVKDTSMASAALQKHAHTHKFCRYYPANPKSLLTELVIYISDEAQKL